MNIELAKHREPWDAFVESAAPESLYHRWVWREVIEETDIRQGVLVNLQWTQVYEILAAFGKVYAPGITRNLEHAFSLRLARRVPVTLSDSEHVDFKWVSGAEAVDMASSSTNRAVIETLRTVPGR